MGAILNILIKRVILLITSLICIASLQAQDPEKYNKIFNKTFIETSQVDFDKALQVADSLYQISETALYKTKSLMLSASLHEQAGDLKKSIQFAEQAGDIIAETDHYDWRTRVEGFLATQYRLLSLFSQSEIHANRALEAAKKIPDTTVSRVTLAMILQEKAFLADIQKNYQEALDYFKQVDHYLEDEKGSFLVAQNYQFKGQTALNLKDYDQALSYLQTALDKWDDLPNNYVKGLIYINLAEVYLEKDDLQKAKVHLDKASEIAQTSSYLEFLSKYYEIKSDYYTKTSNAAELRQASMKRDSIQSILSHQKGKYLDESFSALTTKNEAMINNIKMREYLILGAFVLLLGGLVYFISYKREKNRQVQKFKAILEEFQQSMPLQEEPNAVEKHVEATVSNTTEISQSIEEEKTKETLTEDSIMSHEVEEQILEKLKTFEKSKHFRDPHISLSGLASYCDTNTKYLSYCINQHKGMNFNNYINELRIDYIIDKLIYEPEYRKYKFATLADEAGFSSPNKFSTVFKKITTLAPSVFIKELEKESLKS